MLVRELYPRAQGIDGRGGDGGRDIVWSSPDGLVIFEVKSHTDRLTRGQKNEIERLHNAVTTARRRPGRDQTSVLRCAAK